MRETTTEGGVGHVSGQSNTPMSRTAHELSATDVVRELDANPDAGLTSEEAARRLGIYGPNDLGKQKGVQPIKIFIAQIVNAMTAVSIPNRWVLEQL